MEVAVMIQVSVGNSTNDAKDWEVVAYHNNVCLFRVARHDSIQSGPCSVGHMAQAFSARNLSLGRLSAPEF